MERTDGIWEALARPGFVLSSWPWRALAYLVTTVPVGLACVVALAVLVGVGALTAVIIIGVAMLASAVVLGVPVSELERRRLRLIAPDRLAGAHRAADHPGAIGWLRTRLREPATWREFSYTLLLCTVLWPLDLVLVSVATSGAVLAIGAPLWTQLVPDLALRFGGWTITDRHTAWATAPAGVVLAAVALYGFAVVAGAQGALARYLLAAPPDEVLGARLTEMARSRGRLVDVFEAERRRIERDLHDGAQQRLLALTMELGEARLNTAPDAAVAPALERAQEHAFEALSELRELIRNVHPRVLSDHGLAAALADVADRCLVPVQVTTELPGRLPPAVESAVYLAASEALTNVDRHSGAERAELDCRLAGGTLVLRVADTGAGGADPAAGTGLTGLADRLAVLDGTLSLSSPPGGPTVLKMEIPCGPSENRA